MTGCLIRCAENKVNKDKKNSNDTLDEPKNTQNKFKKSNP